MMMLPNNPVVRRYYFIGSALLVVVGLVIAVVVLMHRADQPLNSQNPDTATNSNQQQTPDEILKQTNLLYASDNKTYILGDSIVETEFANTGGQISEDGRFITNDNIVNYEMGNVNADTHIYTYDIATKESSAIDAELGLLPPHISPDGKYVYYVSGDMAWYLRIYNRETGEKVFSESTFSQVDEVMWLNSDEFIYSYVFEDKTAVARNYATGKAGGIAKYNLLTKQNTELIKPTPLLDYSFGLRALHDGKLYLTETEFNLDARDRNNWENLTSKKNFKVFDLTSNQFVDDQSAFGKFMATTNSQNIAYKQNPKFSNWVAYISPSADHGLPESEKSGFVYIVNLDNLDAVPFKLEVPRLNSISWNTL